MSVLTPTATAFEAMSTRPEIDASRNTDLDEATRSLIAITKGLESAYAALERRAEHVEAELERTNRELSAILDALPCGVVVRDRTGRISRTNRAALELLGSDDTELASNATLAALEADPGATLDVGTGANEQRLHSRAATVVDDAGDEAGSLLIVDDRTELEALTARLLVQDKMAALGTLAAGIAHEIRNPLNAIGGFAGLLEGRLDDAGLRRWAELIGRGSREIDSIVTGLVTMAGGGSLASTQVDARALVDAAVAQVAAHTEAPNRWTIESDVQVEALVGDEVKLRQALRNLVDNAKTAQPDGGAIRVTVAGDANGWTLTVEDDGPGVPNELRARVLEPFYTSRAEGTGLGLALTHTIAELHGGSIEIGDATEPLSGAAFRIHVPHSPIARQA